MICVEYLGLPRVSQMGFQALGFVNHGRALNAVLENGGGGCWVIRTKCHPVKHTRG